MLGLMTVAVAFAATVWMGGCAAADPAADFYKGKQIQLAIGYSPGGT